MLICGCGGCGGTSGRPGGGGRIAETVLAAAITVPPTAGFGRPVLNAGFGRVEFTAGFGRVIEVEFDAGFCCEAFIEGCLRR